jgi:hypothetical protein
LLDPKGGGGYKENIGWHSIHILKKGGDNTLKLF